MVFVGYVLALSLIFLDDNSFHVTLNNGLGILRELMAQPPKEKDRSFKNRFLCQHKELFFLRIFGIMQIDLISAKTLPVMQMKGMHLIGRPKFGFSLEKTWKLYVVIGAVVLFLF